MLFHKINKDIAPPDKFTWPFCYEPHPLCLEAAQLLQNRMENEEQWRDEIKKGKMFGVLVVRDNEGTLRSEERRVGKVCWSGWWGGGW